MAVSQDEIIKRYPIPTYRFRVTVGDDVVAFSKVSGLTYGREKISYKDGMGGLFRMLGQQTDLDFTLTRGIVVAQSQLWKWLSSASGNRLEKKDIAISLTNEAGTELLVTWNVRNAFPTEISAPDFDSSSSEVAIEQVSLSADSLEIEYH